MVFRPPSLLTEGTFTSAAYGLYPVKGVRLRKPSAWGEFVSQVRALYLAFFVAVLSSIYSGILLGIHSGTLSGIPSIWRLRPSGAPWNRELAIEVQQCPPRSGAGEEEQAKRRSRRRRN